MRYIKTAFPVLFGVLFLTAFFYSTAIFGQEQKNAPVRFGGISDFPNPAARIPAVPGVPVPAVGSTGAEELNTSPVPAGVSRLIANIVPNPGGELVSALSPDRVPDAWLVVGIELKPKWYVYSLRPTGGGRPTQITVDLPEKHTGEGKISVGSFLEASPIVPDVLLGEELEKKKETALWVAPLYFEPAEKDSSRLTGLVLTGELDALACTEGENGTCNPLLRKFRTVWNPKFDVSPLLQQAVKEKENADKKSADRKTVSTVGEPVSGTGTASGATAFTWRFLLYAFLGGLILNVMPCVLPVIGLKIISFFEQAGHSRLRALTLNAWYSAGIVCVFIVLALMSVGLSYLFTYGLFQIVMGIIVFAMALSLMGLWELQLPAFLGGRKSDELMQKEGAVGAFFKGIITTLLAIPCGAPLLSPALVWSDSMIQQGQTPAVVLVYIVIAIGMASPYLLVGAFPELLGFLPKPGMWMETFRITMGYVLLTAVIWILFSMPLPLVLPMITLLFAIWFVCWFIGSLAYNATGKVRLTRWLISLVLLVVTVIFSFNLEFIGNPYTLQNGVEAKMIRWAVRAERSGRLEQKHWTLFDKTLFENTLKQGRPVLIDFTADWCMNCKVLESTVLHTDPIMQRADAKNVLTLTADWTNQNADSPEIRAINELLDKYGGRQVPTIMVFDPRHPTEPAVLRGLFTREELEKVLDRLEDQRK